MSALSRIKKAGFDVTLAGDGFEITPASLLTILQREFLKLHKAEIITELQTPRSEIEPPLIKCHDCLKFKSFNAHGNGAGTCLAGVQPSGAVWWSETPHECAKLDACVEWIFYQDEMVNPLAKTVTCYTPNGKAIEVETTSAEHAEFLRRMNPYSSSNLREQANEST